MPIRWNVPQHDAALAQLDAALEEVGAAAVRGPEGVGKSTLAHLAAQRYCARHPGTQVRWVIGTHTERCVPLGAFSHLVHVAELGKPAALVRAALASLTDDGQSEGLMLIVDEAHDLDLISATLIYQLAQAGSAKLIVTARDRGPMPAAIEALCSDGLLTRIDLVPPRDPTGATEVDAFLADLPEAARAVVDYLAVAEPLAPEILDRLASQGAVAAAEQWGAVEARVRSGVPGEPGGEPVIYTVHPLFAQQALSEMGRDGARRRRTELVTALTGSESHGSENGIVDHLRLSSLAIDSDAPQPIPVVIAAAQQALQFGDLALAERLARSAIDRSGDSPALPAQLALAQSMGFQGRGREADAVLGAIDPDALSEPELMAWTPLRAANQFFMLSQPERATAFLRTIRSRITEHGPRITLDALSATFAMNSGNIGRATELADAVLSSPAASDQAVAWAASAGALCAARQGRFGDVEPLAKRALGVQHPGLLRFTVGLAQVSTLLMLGRFDEAQALTAEFTDFAELQQPGRAVGEVILAHVLIARGEFSSAAKLLGPAASALEHTGYSWGPLSLTLLASALAQQGDIPGSAKALRRAENRHGTKSELFAAELGAARAWTRSIVRDTTGALNAAREAARTAERSGQFAVALWVWHDAVRLGDARTADPASRLAARIDCPVGNLIAEHARVLTNRNTGELAAVAEKFAAIGMQAAAADAAAQADHLGESAR